MDRPIKRRKVTFDSLEDLVKRGKNDNVTYIVHENNPLDLIDSHGMTLLHLAAKYNNVDLINFLLHSNSNCNIDAKNSSGATPLFIAAKNQSFDAVEVLLSANASIFGPNAAELTIIDVLLSQKSIASPKIFECLLHAMKRSDVDVDTMADFAIKANCKLEAVLSLRLPKVTEAVLKQMTTIHVLQSQSALCFAMNALDLENIILLLKHGPGKKERMSIFFANIVIMMEHYSVDLSALEVFVKAIIDWNIIGVEQLHFFHNAYTSSSQGVVQVLLQCNMHSHAKSKFGLDLIASLFSNRSVNVIELLKNRKFDVNAKGAGGNSALHYALRSQCAQNVQFLIDKGANLNIKNSMGKTPILDCHAWVGSCLGQLLLQNGADIQVYDYAGVTVYHLANFRTVNNIVIPHLAMLTAQNVRVSQMFDILIKSNPLSTSYECCLIQLKSFKDCRLTESISLFDVLTKKIETIAVGLCTSDVSAIIGQYCLANILIPYYGVILEMKLQKALVYYRAMRYLALVVSAHTGYPIQSNNLVIERIIRFLTYSDVCSLA